MLVRTNDIQFWQFGTGSGHEYMQLARGSPFSLLEIERLVVLIHHAQQHIVGQKSRMRGGHDRVDAVVNCEDRIGRGVGADRGLDDRVVERIVLGACHVVVTVHVIERKHPIASRFESHECELSPAVGARDALHGKPCECRVIEALIVGTHQHVLHRFEIPSPQHDARDAHGVNLASC